MALSAPSMSAGGSPRRSSISTPFAVFATGEAGIEFGERTIVVGHSRSRQAALRRDKTVDPPPRLFMPADVEGFTRVWRDPAGKPAFFAEAWGAAGGTGGDSLCEAGCS